MAIERQVWHINEARARLDDLLNEAEISGPQEIADGSRRFLVTSVPSGKRKSAKEFLERGGPLPHRLQE